MDAYYRLVFLRAASLAYASELAKVVSGSLTPAVAFGLSQYYVPLVVKYSRNIAGVNESSQEPKKKKPKKVKKKGRAPRHSSSKKGL